MTEAHFTQLIGKSIQSPEICAYLESIGAKPSIREFEGDRTYYTFEELGLELVFDQKKLSATHYLGPYSDSDSRPYRGPLPGGLTFTDSKDVVLKKLGAPFRSQVGVDDPRPFVGVRPWVKYRFGNYALHIEFSPGENQIRLITLGKPS